MASGYGIREAYDGRSEPWVNDNAGDEGKGERGTRAVTE
jgi:hypothetical protein